MRRRPMQPEAWGGFNMNEITLEKTKLKSIIESLLFVNERPLSIEELRKSLKSRKKK